MIKHLYILWFQGFRQAPPIIKRCLKSWKVHNPDWTIHTLHNGNLKNYINLDSIVPGIRKRGIGLAGVSDVVRIALMKKYGGVWVDATTFCNQPLNKWLPANIKQGFFAFSKPTPKKLVSSWFLYSSKGNYITSKWFRKVKEYWEGRKRMDGYFWFHHLFNKLYDGDKKFQQIWDQVPKISADGPHYIQKRGRISREIEQSTREHIDHPKSPLYKLIHSLNFKEVVKKSTPIKYLINKINKIKNPDQSNANITST